MINVGDILSTVGCSVLWGDITSTGGVHDARGGYHEVPWGYHPLKFECRGVYHDTCGGIL